MAFTMLWFEGSEGDTYEGRERMKGYDDGKCTNPKTKASGKNISCSNNK